MSFNTFTFKINVHIIPLASYYFGSMFIISLATASTVLTLNTYKKGDDGEPMPEILQRIFFDIVAKILFMRVKVSRQPSILSGRRAYNCSKMSFKNRDNNHNNKKKRKKSLEYSIEAKVERSSSAAIKKPNDKRTTNKTIRPLCNDASNGMLLKDSFSRYNARSIYLFENDQSGHSSAASKANTGEKMEKASLILKASDLEHPTSMSSQGPVPQYFPLITTPVPPLPLSPSIAFSNDTCNLASSSCHDSGNLQRLMRNLTARLETYEKSQIEKEIKCVIKNQWTELARVVDALLGVVFVLSSLLLLIYLVLKTPNFRFV